MAKDHLFCEDESANIDDLIHEKAYNVHLHRAQNLQKPYVSIAKTLLVG